MMEERRMKIVDRAIVKEKILRILNDTIGREYSLCNLSDLMPIREIAAISSITAIEIIAYLENEFEIEVDDENLHEGFISNVEQLTSYVTEKLGREGCANE
jgi:acyl carrier protein